MTKIIGSNKFEKTIILLEIAAEKGYTLVEPTARMVDYARCLAAEHGLRAEVVGLNGFLYVLRGTHEKFLVDDLDMFLDSLGIEGYSNRPET